MQSGEGREALREALLQSCFSPEAAALLRVSDTYAVITSRQIAADPNVPGFLLTLSGRGIIPRADPDFRPAREYLAEHRKEWRL